MLNEIDKEYRKIFLNQRRWAKHWTTNSAHRAHSSTLGMKEPAQKALEYIKSIETLKIKEKERLMLLIDYYKKNNNQFCINSIGGLRHQIRELEENGKSIIYKMPQN